MPRSPHGSSGQPLYECTRPGTGSVARHRPCTPAGPPCWRQTAERCPAAGRSPESWRGARRPAGRSGSPAWGHRDSIACGLLGLITRLAAKERVSGLTPSEIIVQLGGPDGLLADPWCTPAARTMAADLPPPCASRCAEDVQMERSPPAMDPAERPLGACGPEPQASVRVQADGPMRVGSRLADVPGGPANSACAYHSACSRRHGERLAMPR